MAKEVIVKEQVKSAALITKHAKKVATLNKHADEMHAKKAEVWTKLNNTYFES